MTRTRTGCLTCRNRKLKCDEQKPICGQCSKGSRECKPAPGIVFRHEQNASLNGAPSGKLGRFFGYKETFNKDTVWLDTPRKLTFINITDPFNEDLEHGADSPFTHTSTVSDYSPRDRQAFSQAGSAALVASPSATTSPRSLVSPTTAHGGALAFGDISVQNAQVASSSDREAFRRSSIGDLNFILNDPMTDAPPLSASTIPNTDTPALYDVAGPALESSVVAWPNTGQLLFDHSAEDAWLLKHFATGPGHWMDLFDLGRFFEVFVPIKAARYPLLLHSALALSAKSLSRFMLNPEGQSHDVPLKRSVHWYSDKSIEHYDKAITLLRETLQAGTTSPVSHRIVPATSPTNVVDARQDQGQSLLQDDGDEIVGATAILAVYEFLDASEASAEWSSHLDGVKGLFDLSKEGLLAMPRSAIGGRTLQRTSNSRTAVFWNMARQDMLDAFINGSTSRLNTHDLYLWRAVGLHISQDGGVVPSNDPCQDEPMADDMISNALVWLVMQVVNLIGQSMTLSRDQSLGSWTTRQSLLDRGVVHMRRKLDRWFSGLPDSFRPVATIPQTQGKNTLPPEVRPQWYVRPMCASTMQWYHFAEIQLIRLETLAAREQAPPPEWSFDLNLDARHWTEPRLDRAVRHATAVMSIGLGQSDEGVTVHSVQPLYAAGQVLLEGPGGAGGGGDRKRNLGALRECLREHMLAIEQQTGWATRYRVDSLAYQWFGARP